MVVQNENIVTFLMLFAPFSFPPFFLSAFEVRLHTLLCTPLIVFLHQLHTTKSPFELLYGQTPYYSSLRVFGCACFVSLPPHERTKLQPCACLSCFLGYGVSQKGFCCYDLISHCLVSPVMLSFGNIILSRVFSSFLRPLPPSLPFLLIFSSLFILNLWRILRHQSPL